MDAWLTVGLLQTAFVALILARRAQIAPASFWLFAWLAVAFVHQFSIYFGYAHPTLLARPLAIGLGLLPFLHGPLALCYVSAFLPDRWIARTAPLHLAPFFAVWGVALALDANAGGVAVDTRFAITTFHDASGAQIAWPAWMMALSGGAYPLASLFLLRHARPALLSTRSEISAVHFRWLEIWVFGHLAAFASIFFLQYAFSTRVAMVLTSWVLAAEVFYLGAFGVWGFETGPPRRRAPPAKPAPDALDGDVARLMAFMKDEKPYRQPGLTLAGLSTMSGLSEPTITSAVKQAGYKHFFDFVNAFRCDEVKARLDAKPSPADSLLTVALEAGFNSKSAFNRVFKARIGLTPSQYRDRAAE